MLSTKKMVNDLPYIEYSSQICERYVLAKQPRNVSHEENFRANKLLQLIHSDVCDPIVPTSFSKHQYILTFINYYTRKFWIYFLKEKREVFSMFKKFKTFVEYKSGFYIKTIHSNQGGQFTSRAFKDFCDEHSIRHQLIASYSP